MSECEKKTYPNLTVPKVALESEWRIVNRVIEDSGDSGKNQLSESVS